jgi:hypothetical protein
MGEADIASGGKRDFATILDGLFVPFAEDVENGAKPSIPFDYLAVADELHSGKIKVSSDGVAAAYRENDVDLVAEFGALLDQVKLAASGDDVLAGEKLPPIDAKSIATELGLDAPVVKVDFGRIRRNFAFANHPDRVAPHLRQHAMVRMQVANMLIDEAKRRALAATRR